MYSEKNYKITLNNKLNSTYLVQQLNVDGKREITKSIIIDKILKSKAITKSYNINSKILKHAQASAISVMKKERKG